MGDKYSGGGEVRTGYRVRSQMEGRGEKNRPSRRALGFPKLFDFPYFLSQFGGEYSVPLSHDLKNGDSGQYRLSFTKHKD